MPMIRKQFVRRNDKPTIVEGFEVSYKFDIFIDRCFFWVDGPSQHMTAELHVIFSWRTTIKI